MSEFDVRYRDLRQMLEQVAAEKPDYPYLWFYDDVVTYRDLDGQVNQFAAALSELGAGRGDIVYVYMGNSARTMVACLAAAKLGAVAGPINILWQAPEISYLLNDSRGRFLVCDPPFAPMVDQLRGSCPSLEVVIENAPEPAAGNLSMDALMDAQKPDKAPPADIDPDDVAFLYYTSGTTGNPKGTLLTHKGILWCIEGLKQCMEKGTDEEPVMLVFLPLFHVNAMMSMISVIYRGISATLRVGFSPAEFGEVVERYKPSFFSAVPAVYNILLQTKDEQMKHDLSSLKYCICGAAPMPVALFEEFEKVFGISIIEGYGLTEGTVASTMNPRDGVRKIGSIGKALPGQEVRIMDEDGNLLLPGQVGEIVIRAPSVMKGYLGKPAETEEALAGGWLHTGDMGRVDEDGYFFIVDRKKDMYIRGGENVYPVEVEGALFAHPQIADAAVIGVPDEVMGEEGKAFIVPRAGEQLDLEDVRAFCQKNLAKFKIPKYFEVVDSLPKNVIGKTLRKKLREIEESKRT
ncbi:MAG: class I adenylate-forming enzyme family protein [Actinomycetota bacterium]